MSSKDHQESPSTRQEQAQATRAHICGVALRLFAERGYSATSTRRIAEEAGVSEGLIFHHFGTKKDLLHAVASSRRSFADRIAELVEGADEVPVERCVRAIGEGFVTMLDTDTPEGHMVAMLVGESQTHPELHEIFAQIIGETVESLGRYLEARIAAGELREDLQTDAAARAFLGPLMLFFMTHAHEDSGAWEQQASRHVDSIVEFWLAGVLRRRQ
jgi:AcrR family transcriptional regulator